MPAEELRPPPESADELRRRAEDILARDEFRPEPRSLYERLVDFLVDQLDQAVSALLGGGRSALVGWLVVAVVVALLVVAAARFGRAGWGGRDRLGGDGVDVEQRRPAEHWRADAAAHEARGEWRAALRCRYRALVADLARRGVVEEVPGRTTGEYRREVAEAAPRVSADFAEVTARFERAWYGDRPTGEDDVGAVRSLADRVLGGV